MNFDIMCFGWVGDSLRVVNHEYFDTLDEALEYQAQDGRLYESTSITPMNAEAEAILRKGYLR